MVFTRSGYDTFELRDIHPFIAEMLREVPQWPGRNISPRSLNRLFPAPTEDPADEDIRQDWRDLVQPGLETLFQSSRDVVAADLAAMQGNDGHLTLRLPAGHIDAWLNALNQARLILAEENAFTDEELSRPEPPDLETKRGLALFKIGFYAHLQEVLISTTRH